MEPYTNHLKGEESPYLKQHSENPVDWYPWGEEAFNLAKKLDKPVFLSIGYSTCHWCHVMERESFSKAEVGKAMNDAFVCIKVDREERPDVDSYYMSIAIAERGGGGWPLNMILTPDKKPIVSFTYLPIHSIHGNIGIVELSETIKTLWKDERESLMERAIQLLSSVDNKENSERVRVDSEKLFKDAFTEVKKVFDYEYGGIGNGMKFPSPHSIIFLIKYYNYFDDKEALQMAEDTLLAMRRGGIFDHVGYGFHRYSTDREWKTPHFEKMLYDQAWIMMSYAYAYSSTGKDIYKQVIDEIYQFLQSEMKSSDGGYYTAIDADSEGVEGKFYLWSTKELREILKGDYEEFAEIFQIQEDGNFINERDQSVSDLNIIYPRYNSFRSQGHNDDLRFVKDPARQQLNKLLEQRNERIRPDTDTKILASTNGMLLAAFSIAYMATFEDKYMNAASELFDFIKNRFIKGDEILRLRYTNGKEISGFLEDYANIINGIFQFYRITIDQNVLNLFENLMKSYLLNVTNKTEKYPKNSVNLEAMELSDLYDGAIPSPNSILLRNKSFFALINDNYELAMDNIEVHRNQLSNISSYGSSYLWLITSFFEIDKLLVIKTPDSWINIQYIQIINQIKRAEKTIIRKNINISEICTISKCIYKNANEEEQIEKLKSL